MRRHATELLTTAEAQGRDHTSQQLDHAEEGAPSVAAVVGGGTSRWLLIGLLTALVSSQSIGLAGAKRASGSGKFRFEFVTVTLLQEVTKLSMAYLLFQQEVRSGTTWLGSARGANPESNVFRVPRFLLFAIPGLLYCFDNNFQYIILYFLAPAELNILWNFKIVATALLMRVFLGRRYQPRQWVA